MTRRMNDNLVKAFFFMIMLIVFLFQALFANAEGLDRRPLKFTSSSAHIPFYCEK